MSNVHRILDHGWEPGSRVRIDVAIEHEGRRCYVRRIGVYRYMGYLSYFDVSLGGRKVKLGGEEMNEPFHVSRLPRGAKCE